MPSAADHKCDTHLLYFSVQCDYTLVQSSFTQLEAMCKASWEQLKVLERCDEKRKGGKGEKKKGKCNDESFSPEGSLRHRLPKVLKECEERLKVLRAVHRRVINRCSADVQHISNKILQLLHLPVSPVTFVLKVPLVPLIPGLLPGHGEGHQSRRLLQDHQQLLVRVQVHSTGHPPAARAREAEERS